MATRMPQAARCCESQATSGVLPVPPTVRLPTTTTGTSTRVTCRSPRRYSTLRKPMTAPYSRESGMSHGDPDSEYQRRSSDERAVTSALERGALERGVRTIARGQLRVRAALDDPPLGHDDDFVGVLDGGQSVRDDQRGPVAHERG